MRNDKYFKFALLIVYLYKQGKDIYKSIPSDIIYSIINRKSDTFSDRTHIFFKMVDVDDFYKFNQYDNLDNKCKSYKLNERFRLEIMSRYISDKVFSYENRECKVNGFIFDEKIYNTKKDILSINKISRRNMEKIKIDKEQYLGLMTREYRFNESIKNDYTNLPHNPLDMRFYAYNHEPTIEYRVLLNGFEDVIKKVKDNEVLSDKEKDTLHLAGTCKILQNFKKLVYNRDGFGRLYNISLSTIFVNLQQLPKKMRSHIFQGQYEYDMSTAVATLLTQYSYNIGDNRCYTYIDAYIRDKNFFRNKIVDLGFSIEEAKTYFTSLFFGANVIDTHFKSRLLDTFTKEQLEELYEIDSISSLVTECYELFEYIKNYHKPTQAIKNFEMINSVGMKYKFRNERDYDSKIVPFIYQGIEASIIDVIKEKYKVSLLIFDGFISPTKLDLNELQNYVLEKTGYEITFSESECISMY